MKIKKVLFPALLVGAGLALARRAVARPAAAKQVEKSVSYNAIEAYVEEQMHRLHIPGAALAIVEGDRIVHRRGFGQACPGGEAPGSQTSFFIGSLTKSFTATAVMQLVEAGRVELDAPVQRYLPWFRVADPEASARMTVRHLLNQTSGMGEMAGSLILADLDDRPDAAERQARTLAGLKLSSSPGEKVQYCNLNFNLLGLVIEAASGEDYASYIQKHLYDPLDMRHSYTSKAAAQQDGLAMGYRHWFSLPFPAPDVPIPRGSLAAGQLISCAEDMAHYLIAHLNGGRYRDAQILSQAGIDDLHRGVADYVQFGISGGLHGMGWFTIDLDGTQTLSHSGNTPEFSAFMALIPGQAKGMVLLFNADPYGLPPIVEEIGLGATALLAGQPPHPIKLDFIQWIFRLLPLIPLLQVAGIVATLRQVRRWRREPALRPAGGRLWRHLLLPLAPDVALMAGLVYLQSSGLLGFLNLFMPDLARVAGLSGGLAGGCAMLRTGMVVRAVKE